MTWLLDLPAGATDWERVSALAPDAFAALADVHKTVRSRVDPVVLELCRLRMAMLLRSEADHRLRDPRAVRAGLAEEKVRALADWPTSQQFSPAERACLALAEQFVIDVTGVTDDLVDAVLTHLSAEDCYGLVSALWAFEAQQSLCLALGIEPEPTVLALDADTHHR
jgi:alkylhydroperoxidase family enzyme